MNLRIGHPDAHSAFISGFLLLPRGVPLNCEHLLVGTVLLVDDASDGRLWTVGPAVGNFLACVDGRDSAVASSSTSAG